MKCPLAMKFLPFFNLKAKRILTLVKWEMYVEGEQISSNFKHQSSNTKNWKEFLFTIPDSARIQHLPDFKIFIFHFSWLFQFSSCSVFVMGSIGDWGGNCAVRIFSFVAFEVWICGALTLASLALAAFALTCSVATYKFYKKTTYEDEPQPSATIRTCVITVLLWNSDIIIISLEISKYLKSVDWLILILNFLNRLSFYL